MHSYPSSLFLFLSRSTSKNAGLDCDEISTSNRHASPTCSLEKKQKSSTLLNHKDQLVSEIIKEP